MLTPNQKRTLKSLASTLKIRYQIGKNEISESLITMLDKALTAHELIKVDVMKGCTLPIMEVAIDIANSLNAELVQVMGRVIILYRKSKDNPKIKI
ncbi:MAG: YhbY family RNA-binding protein [Erysipelotrichaceae bacterium]|jgi:RNA-binding protein|nr:YhbY family RNA-binding protein [Erysipelotrichaceae bacterium]